MPPKGWKKPTKEQAELDAIQASLGRYEHLLRWWARGRGIEIPDDAKVRISPAAKAVLALEHKPLPKHTRRYWKRLAEQEAADR